MIPKNRIRRCGGTLLLLSAILFSSGCSKQLAKLRMNRASKVLADAQQYDVGDHAGDLLQTANGQLNQANQSLAGGDSKAAAASAREAVSTAKAALERAKQFEATERRDAADVDVEVMKINHGDRENADLYQEIIETQQDMHEKYNKQKWVPTIELAQEIGQNVERLLLRLRRQAMDDLVAVRVERQRLIDEEGLEHAPRYVRSVDDLTSQIVENIEAKRDYLTAIELSKQAMMESQLGITEAKKKRCEIAMDTIQKKLIRAQRLQAEFFAPDLWSSASDDFASLVENFWKKEYDFVLTASTPLENTVDTLIYETRKRSADYQIGKLQERIKDLRDKGVAEYLPGRLDPVEAKLGTAQDLFQPPAERFEEVETTCKEAQLLADSIMSDFREMAEGYMSSASKITDVASTLYRDMTRIFAAVHPEYVKPQDQALENNKEAIREEMGRRLSHAQADLSQAEVKFSGEDYKAAIELSKSVEDEATTIIATIYSVVAHNVITEIADQITRYDREGAEEHAKAEMALTKKLLGEAIELRNAGQFKESSSKAAEARAELERTIEAIQEAAAQRIQSAQAALEESNAARTAQLQPDAYQEVQRLIGRAQTLREATELKESIQTAEQAREIALRASQDAARIWSENTQQAASVAIDDARESGANIYGAAMLRDASEDAAQAQTVYQSAQDLLGQQRYVESRQKFLQAQALWAQAAERARRAKYRLIDEASAAIVEARSYDAWKHQLPELTEAVLTLEAAQDALEADQYARSHELARDATATAEKVTGAAKRITFQNRMAVMDNLLHMALDENGGRFYRPETLTALAREMDKIRTQYQSKQYDSAAAKMAEVESQLEAVVDAMPDLVKGWQENQRERLEGIAEADIPPTFEPRVSEARKYLRYAELDYEREKYRSSYTNLLTAYRLIDGLSVDWEEEQYRDKAEEFLAGLDDAMTDFERYVTLSPSTLEGLTRGPDGARNFVAITGRASPSEFRELIEDLLAEVATAEPPATMVEFHEKVRQMLITARQAAIRYEQLRILSELERSERRKVITEAYDLMMSAREMKNELEEELVSATTLAQKM